MGKAVLLKGMKIILATVLLLGTCIAASAQSPYAIFGDNSKMLEPKSEPVPDIYHVVHASNDGSIFYAEFNLNKGVVVLYDEEDNVLQQDSISENSKAIFTTMDPHAESYYQLSPYSYCGGNPINAIDPDGRKILFVNGYWSRIIGGLIGSSSPSKSYWGKGFSNAAQVYFDDYSSIDAGNYIDGSSSWGGDMDGSDRWNAGYIYAKNNIDILTKGLHKGEVFNIVTHSEGAAYGAGIAQYLINQGYTVAQVLHLSVDEGDEFSTPREPFTMQLAYRGDWITNNKKIKNTDKFGIMDSSDLSLFQVHGTTKSAAVFKAAQDLKTAMLIQNMEMVGGQCYTWYSVQGGTTPNGTIFTNINNIRISR